MRNDEKILGYFEKEASDFDAAYGGAPERITDFIRRAAYRVNKKPIEGRLNALVDLVGECTGKKICEVGCGPGFYSIRLAQKGAKVLAYDYAPSMIEAAKKNALRAQVSIDFRQLDITRDSAEGIHDCVFATGVIEYIDPRFQKACLQKMMAASNGSVIVSFPKKNVLHAFVRNFWLRYFKGINITFFSNDDILKLSEAVGLKEIDRRDVGILYVVKFAKA